MTRGLYALKPWYSRRLARITTVAAGRNISPDWFTAAGVLAAAGAAGVLLGGAGWAVGPLLAARLAGANLDGAVARARGVSRPWGFVLNELGDRVSDLLMFAAVAVVGPHVLALAALAAATLPTFASLAAAGAGVARANGGPFGKTERCLAVAVGALLPGWWTPLLWLVIGGSLVTAALRLCAAHAPLRMPAPGGAGR